MEELVRVSLRTSPLVLESGEGGKIGNGGVRAGGIEVSFGLNIKPQNCIALLNIELHSLL